MPDTVPENSLAKDLEDPLMRLRNLASDKANTAQDIPVAPTSPELVELGECLGLSSFEMGVVLLCLCAEFSSEAAGLCASLRQSEGDPRPSFRLATAAYPTRDWGNFGPQSALRYWQLIDQEPNGSFLDAPIRASEFLINWACGGPSRDERLLGLVHPFLYNLAPAHPVADDIIAFWAGAGVQNRLTPPVLIFGQSAGIRRDVARAAATGAGLTLERLWAGDVPAQSNERVLLAQLVDREAFLFGKCLVIECDPETPAALLTSQLTPALRLAEALQSPVIVSAPAMVSWLRDDAVSVAVSAPDIPSRREIWKSALGEMTPPHAMSALDRFQIDSDSAQQVAAIAATQQDGGTTDAAFIQSITRKKFRAPLEEFAERVLPVHKLDDLVLTDTARQLLMQFTADIQHQPQVLEQWGFGGKMNRGTGLTAIFSGSSGVGKTTAAEALALEIDRDLFRIDLSQVISKYIGETEQRLSRIFSAAERAASILLFDEGEALFGKRTEVREGRDRYANQEVSYLLQRMESFDGVAILTTNQRDAIDPAFLRRFRYVIEFDSPGESERVALWQRVFPQETPVSDLDYEKLGKIVISGGHIRNIALHAALRASEENRIVTMYDIRDATVQECRKLRKSMPPDTFDGW